MTLLEAIDDPYLFRPWFKKPKHWMAWRTFFAALFGLGLDPPQFEIFRECTHRAASPTKPVKEAWMVIGRRGGKSFALALIAVFLACFSDYRRYLAPGERGTVMIISADKKQARTILRYIRGLLNGVPMLKAMIQRETAEAFDLTNSTTIEVGSASYKRTRGYTLVAALCDEMAFWPTEDAANPDYLILDALRPGMATIPNSMLLCASSPYAKRGALWDAYSKHFGKNDPNLLIWQADTCTMNPTRQVATYVAQKYEDDPVSAAAEYGAQFRTDLEAFVSREVVAAATVPGRHELPPLSSIKYTGFYDAAGGSGADSFTASTAHLDRVTNRVVIDAVREIHPPFSPEAAIGQLAQLFKRYRVQKVTADRYAAEFPRELFQKFGISVVPSEMSASQIYAEFLPLLNSGRVELLDLARLSKQLCALERRTSRTGRDQISHPPAGHDDVINSVAGAAVLAGTSKAPMTISPEVLARARQPGPSRAQLNGRYGKPPCFF